MRVVFFDLETGGLDETRHPIIQIAAIAVDWQSLDVIGEFERKIDFDKDACTPEALSVNSYDSAVWARDSMDMQEVIEAFSGFLGRHQTVPMMSRRGKPYRVAQLAAYNAEFDWRFIRHAYESFNQFLPASYSVLCTLQRVRWHFAERAVSPPNNFKLTTVCDHLGIDTTGAHDAQADNRMQLELCRYLRKEMLA